jgi:hypothetical protein
MSAMIFVVSLLMWCFSLFGQQSQAAPLRRRGNEKCYHRRQLCCIPDTESETDSFEGDRIEVDFVFHNIVHNDVVSCS